MRVSLFPIFSSLVLAACGGGGTGLDSAQTQSTSLALTSANYESVSQSTLEGSDNLSVLSSGTTSLLTGVQMETPPAWMPALISQVKKIKSWSITSPAVLSGVETTSSTSCSYGGSATISLNDANQNNDLDAGDSMTFSFVNCAGTYGERLNGTATAVINSFNSSTYSAVDFTMKLNNVSLISDNSTSSATGDIRLRLLESSSNTKYWFDINNLTSSITVSDVTESYGISGFSMFMTEVPIGSNQMTYGGTISMSRFGDQFVTVSTASPWLMSKGATYPYSGQLLVTGQSGSKIRITALSSSSVNLELDATGDGIYEESKMVTWASLK